MTSIDRAETIIGRAVIHMSAKIFEDIKPIK